MAGRIERSGGDRWWPVARLRLLGAGGEPVDLRRTFVSHGVVRLAPHVLDAEAGVLIRTERLPDGSAATARLRPSGDFAAVESSDRLDVAEHRSHLRTAALRMLNLEEDLSPFYERVRHDPQLAWVTRGAGRLLRSPTVFEDVVKTLCTTNCSWGATVRMTTSLVGTLGARAPDGSAAFPTPEAMADAGLDFYRDEVRAGYRAAFLHRLSVDVAEGTLDLESLRDPAIPDEEVRRRLLRLPGIGPYAAAHVMLIALGRYGELIFDSWTRPKYARLTGRPVTDRAVRRRFTRYGRYAGLAFWLVLTEDWLEG